MKFNVVTFVLLLNAASCVELDNAYSGPWNWIVRGGNKLWEDGKEFRFSSYNIANLLLIENRPVKSDKLWGFNICKGPIPNPTYDNNGYGYGSENGQTCIIPKNANEAYVWTGAWATPTPWETRNALQAIRGSNGRVVRAYTLGFGETHHVQGPGKFYEPAWVAMDYVLALAREQGVRLIIPLVNHHWGSDSDGPGMFGDYASMTQWRGLKPSQFFTERVVIDDLKNIITFMLNRKNTVNGIYYKDDPTVLCWETGNELGGWEQTVPPAAWTIEIANHIKWLSPKALVMDGTMGALDGPNRWRWDVLQSNAVDMFSNHYYYGEGDYWRITRDAQHIADYNNKIFVIGEFGFNFWVCNKIYEMTLADRRITGALIWSLRYASRDGGFYTHAEGTEYWSYHVPGFPKADGFGADDAEMAPLVRKYGLLMEGKSENTPYPLPASGRPIENDKSIGPTNLKWFSSAWAARYMIFRRQSTDNYSPTVWKLLTSNVMDNVKSGEVFYS